VAANGRTELVGPAVPSDDLQVIRALLQAAVPTEEPLREYRIGIRNVQGAVYRMVRLCSLAEKSRFRTAMTALGFEEESGLAGAPLDGYDATFARRR
jgi:hypothetical protein